MYTAPDFGKIKQVYFDKCKFIADRQSGNQCYFLGYFNSFLKLKSLEHCVLHHNSWGYATPVLRTLMGPKSSSGTNAKKSFLGRISMMVPKSLLVSPLSLLEWNSDSLSSHSEFHGLQNLYYRRQRDYLLYWVLVWSLQKTFPNSSLEITRGQQTLTTEVCTRRG